MRFKAWPWVTVLSLFILLVSSVLACASGPSSMPAAQPSQVEQAEKKPAQIQISSITIKPSTVMVDQPAIITVTVNNSGDITGSYTVPLLIDGQEVDSKDVLVDPGTPREASFQVTRAAAGSYEITVGNSIARLTVCEWTPQTIQYDSGVLSVEGWATYLSGKYGHIVHFTPLAKPFKIQKVSISATTKVKNYADLHKRMFTVRIWNENKTRQLWSEEFPWDLFETWGWQDIDVPDIIADGDFHVEIVTNSDTPNAENLMAVHYEASKGDPRSGISYMGNIIESEKYWGKDKRWFIKASGQGPSEICVPENYGTGKEEEIVSEPEAKLITSSAELIFEDDFSDSSSSWPVESTENSEWHYENGEYHGLVKVYNWFSGQFSPTSAVLTDFILEADGRLVSGPEDSRYGLCFRAQNEGNFYRFLVSEEGYYLIGTKTNGQWTKLGDWTKSTSIKTGNSTNHLKVVCKGSQIVAYINGNHIITITDESFSDGRVGFIIDTIEPEAHIAFDNFKLYKSE